MQNNSLPTLLAEHVSELMEELSIPPQAFLDEFEKIRQKQAQLKIGPLTAPVAPVLVEAME